MSSLPDRLAALERHTSIVVRLLPRALEALQDDARAALQGSTFDAMPSSASESTAVERAALSRDRSRVAVGALLADLARLERATHALAMRCAQLAPPRARMVNGRPVVDCANVHGCPTAGHVPATADPGARCKACRWFHEHNGRDRTQADEEARRERERAAARERMRRKRAQQ